MSEWWTYRLEDFLLFSPRVYWRMFELHNAQLWPLHLLTLALGLAIVLPVFLRARGSGLWVGFILAALWIFVGWFFLWKRYATINWAIAYVSPAWGLEALLLAAAALRGGLVFERQDVTARAGWLIAGLGLLVYSALPPLFERPWSEAEIFGIAPDPTAMVTLGLAQAARGRFALLLVPVPVAWLLLSGLTLRTMGDPQGWIPLLTAGALVIALAVRLVQAPRATQGRSGRHRR
jgi:hypothetical protein